jgi:uncharacterized phage-associated protein
METVLMDSGILVQLIVEEAAARGEVLSPIRVVKLLYLADVYYARYHNGQTLTGWPWRFVHYGPYCREAMAVIDQAKSRGLVAAIPYQSQYDGEEHVLYKGIGTDLASLRNVLPLSVVGALGAAIARWASDTQGLLDHVYFETEPMKAAKRGDILDFSGCTRLDRPAEVIMKTLTRDQIAKAREAVSRLREKLGAGMAEQDTRWKDEILDQSYAQFLEALRDPILETGLEGKAKLGELT